MARQPPILASTGPAISKRVKRTSPPTIRDIAREARVSPTTVSLALEDKPTSRVSAATRKRIQEIADRLDYKPNYVARTLATRRSQAIGLVVPTLLNPIYAEFAQDLIDRADQVGYGIIICSASGDPEDQRRAAEDLLNRGVDGLIICSSLRNSPIAAELTKKGVPLVLALRSVERAAGQPPVDFVGVDNRLGGFRATAHLLRMGHRRIALLSGPQETSTGFDRQQGAAEAFKAHGLEMDPDLILEGDFYRPSGYNLARNLLARRERPTAIFAANDNMAVGVIGALRENGLKAPDDLALVGYDDIELARLPGIDLTTVSQKRVPLGPVVLDKLIAKIDSVRENASETVLFDPVLVIRKSCGFEARGGVYELEEAGAAA